MKTAKCTAHSSSTGKPCGNRPALGATVCRWHGGAAPQVKAKAAERVAEEMARRALRRIADDQGPAEPVANPLLELSRIAGEALRWKRLVAEHVAQLEQLRYQGVSGEQVRAEILLFERALDRCAAVLATIVRLNIDERLAAITEQQGHVLAGVVVSVLERLDLGDKADTARELIAVELEQLDAA
jgi:hypothetical protein